MNSNPEKPKVRRRGGWWVLAIAALAIAILFMRPQKTSAPLPPEVSVAEATTMRSDGAFVIDVRQPEEWAEGHVPGSHLIPLDDLQSRLGEVPRDRKILVVCHSGKRSRYGRDILLQAGYPQVASMTGGLAAWEAEGKPTVTGP